MMDWNLVKKMTLWDYEELISKISEVFSYNLIRVHYNHSMMEATGYVRKLLGYNMKYAEYVNRMTSTFESLNSSKIENYRDLLHKVENREKCEVFLRKAQLPFEYVILSLNHIFRWVLPHRLYLRELVDTENKAHNDYIEKLRSNEIRFNLDILEHGRIREGRENLSKEHRIPKSFISDMVDLADMSRLPYSNRKTVKHLFAAGYNSVAKLAQTNSEKLLEDMKLYFEGTGVRLSGFIDLKGIAQWAKIIPIVVED